MTCGCGDPDGVQPKPPDGKPASGSPEPAPRACGEGAAGLAKLLLLRKSPPKPTRFRTGVPGMAPAATPGTASACSSPSGGKPPPSAGSSPSPSTPCGCAPSVGGGAPSSDRFAASTASVDGLRPKSRRMPLCRSPLLACDEDMPPKKLRLRPIGREGPLEGPAGSKPAMVPPGASWLNPAEWLASGVSPKAPGPTPAPVSWKPRPPPPG